MTFSTLIRHQEKKTQNRFFLQPYRKMPPRASFRGYLRHILEGCYLDASETISISTCLSLNIFPKATFAKF